MTSVELLMILKYFFRNFQECKIREFVMQDFIIFWRIIDDFFHIFSYLNVQARKIWEFLSNFIIFCTIVYAFLIFLKLEKLL